MAPLRGYLPLICLGALTAVTGSGPTVIASSLGVDIVTDTATSAVTILSDDIETVRQRSLVLFCWPAASTLPAVASNARALAAKLNSSCYWPDINYSDKTAANWDVMNHLARLTTMAQALATPGSPAFEDAALSKSYHCALDVFLFAKPAYSNSNWWYKWIGISLQLQVQFLMLTLNRTTASEQASFVNFSYDSAWWIDSYGGGANLVWMIQAELLRGLATTNTTAISQSFSRMWQDVALQSAVKNGQGIQDDFSYHVRGEGKWGQFQLSCEER